MSDPNDAYDAHEAAWQFEDITKFGHAAARAQQQRLKKYISENNPALFVALTTEAARFDVVRRTVIETTMRAVAEEASQQGWHTFIVLDDDLDRLDVFATPGIRFYCSRRPSRRSIGELIWPPRFIAFYGCAQTRAVRTHTEFSEVDDAAIPSRSAPIEYQDVTSESVRAVLVAFIDDLRRRLAN